VPPARAPGAERKDAALTDERPSIPLTRTEWASHRLRRAILSGELAPGSKLVATTLANEWNVSPTPLREAFVRLAESGLVELTPQRGARVTSVSAADATEIFELRLLLEPDAVERSIARTDDEHVALLEAALATLQHELDGGDLESSIAAHRRFHSLVIDHCPGSWLVKLCNMLSEHSGRYQVLSPFGDDETTVRMSEHRQLVDAFRTRDAGRAREIMNEHLRQSLKRFRSWDGPAPSTDGAAEDAEVSELPPAV